MPVRPKLRLGLVLENLQPPGWIHALIERLSQTQSIELAVVVVTGSAPTADHPAGYRLYNWLEDRLFKPGRDALAARDATDLLARVPQVELAATWKGDDLHLDNTALLEAHGIEIFLHLGPTRLAGPILELAPHGVWWYGPDSFALRPVLAREPVTPSTLVRLGQTPASDALLCASYGRTHRVSVNLNRSQARWKSAAFAPRLLQRLYHQGHLEESAPPPPTKPPSNTALLGLLGGHLGRCLGLGVDKVQRRGQWTLLYGLGDNPLQRGEQFTELIPPADRCWADPFIVYQQNRYYVFFEELIFARKRAHLAVMEMDEAGQWTAPVKILQRDYHLSYPFVFVVDGTYYMIPETAANRTVEVYRCEEFPHRWTFYKNLMEGVRAADTTLHQHQGRWWLWTNMAEGEGTSTRDEVFLFYADHPLSTSWTPHPLNPVVSDVRWARPAGRLFEREGQLIRPSQDGSVRYGYCLHFNRVTHLSPTQYREEPVHTLGPDWTPDLVGVHTYNHAHRLTLIDGKFQRRRFG
ncbi:MAG: hypothetical protein GKR89_06570 [Candidatus Latescibacteria bacterium]|nr:hypothetical protein [Candidatus Latescibacterota bacterium]